jgi:hypothetical protein
MRRRWRSGAGFSILEVVVAAGLLALALAALAPLLTLAIRSDSSARLRTVAVASAQQKLEELLPVAADVGGADRVDVKGQAVPAGAPGALFSRRWSIVPLPADPVGAVIVRVEVTIAAVGAPAPPMARLTTIRRRLGP